MTPIEYDKFYHIFNRGNNYEDIFRQKSDYLHFLNLLDIYITTVADVYAWALLRNHFHLLVRIKDESEIGFLNSEHAKSKDIELKWRTYHPVRQTILCPPDESMSSDFPSSGGHGNVEGNDKDLTIPCPPLSDEGMSNQQTNFVRKPKPQEQFKHLFNVCKKTYKYLIL